MIALFNGVTHIGVKLPQSAFAFEYAAVGLYRYRSDGRTKQRDVFKGVAFVSCGVFGSRTLQVILPRIQRRKENHQRTNDDQYYTAPLFKP